MKPTMHFRQVFGQLSNPETGELVACLKVQQWLEREGWEHPDAQSEWVDLPVGVEQDKHVQPEQLVHGESQDFRPRLR